MTGEGSPWSTAPSDDLHEHMQPLAISISNIEPPTRSDVTLAPALIPAVNIPAPIGSLEGISPIQVPMRRHLTPCDPQGQLKRHSAEVTPQPTSYKEGGQYGKYSYSFLFQDVMIAEGTEVCVVFIFVFQQVRFIFMKNN